MVKSHELIAMKIFESFVNSKQKDSFFQCRRQDRITKQRTIRYLETLFMLGDMQVTITAGKSGIRLTEETNENTWP